MIFTLTFVIVMVLPSLSGTGGQRSRRCGSTGHQKRCKDDYRSLWDISGDMIVKDMDAAGIDKSVLLAIDWGLSRHLGDLKLSIEEINKTYADAVKKHPQRLIAFAGIDPRRNNAAKLVEKFLKE